MHLFTVSHYECCLLLLNFSDFNERQIILEYYHIVVYLDSLEYLYHKYRICHSEKREKRERKEARRYARRYALQGEGETEDLLKNKAFITCEARGLLIHPELSTQKVL